MRDYCVRRVPIDDVNDAMAEVFTVVWRRLSTAPHGDDVRLWVYGIARNVVANQRRSARRTRRLTGKLASLGRSPGIGPEPVVVRRSEDERLITALEELRPAERELLRLRAWENLSSIEIGQVLGTSADAVDMRLVRARRKLAKLAGFPQPTRRTDARPAEGGEQ